MSVTWPDVMKFDVPDNAIIFDIGGYKGDWVKIAMDNYKNPTIYVFEPVKRFYDEIVNRWKDNPNVKVYNFGLSDKNREEEISIEGDSSSVFLKKGSLEKIQLKDIREFLFEEKIFNVHLAKINIEGEEYRLMEYLISTPELNIFENYLIQFHTFIDNHIDRRNKIVEGLSEYYDRIFNFEFIFEGWSMKKIQKINCLGDSHISIFANTETLVKENLFHFNNPFNVLRFGPYLAYNLPSKKEFLNQADGVDFSENLLICFGEVDCRAQVKRISDSSSRAPKDIIDEIVTNYFSAIDKVKNKNIILFSVAPELKEEPHWYYYKDNPEVFDCPKGTLLERQQFKIYYNSRVKEESEKRGFKYVSIFDYIVHDNKANEMYYLDDIHLSSKRVLYLIKREMIKAGL
jgi:FkbM family methyltransferase